MRIRQRCSKRLPDTPKVLEKHVRRATLANKRIYALLLMGFFPFNSGWLPPIRHARTSCAPRKSCFPPAKLRSKPSETEDEESHRQHFEQDIGKRIVLSNDSVKRGKDDEKHRHLEEDIGKRLSISNKEKATSALSQPNHKDKVKSKLSTTEKQQTKKHKKRTGMKQHKSSSGLPPSNKPESSPRASSTKQALTSPSFSSLLPPPLPSLKSNQSQSLSSGLSSWEEFLGRADTNTSPTAGKNDDQRLLKNKKPSQSQKNKTSSPGSSNLELPSIGDFFPPDLTTTKKESSTKALDGVLPVSELFYRSSQAIEGETEERKSSISGDEGDDEELPFSAEQSDQLMTDGNKVRIRRNRAAEESKRAAAAAKKRPNHKSRKNRGRKLVRRGMEMFLGGTPINADPPQRAVELTYQVQDDEKEKKESKWASTITLNTRDFGPLLYTPSADLVTPVELGLFCEHFVSSTMNWDICPKDLREMARSHMLDGRLTAPKTPIQETESKILEASAGIEIVNGDDAADEDDARLLGSKDKDDNTVLSLLRRIDDTDDDSAAQDSAKEDSSKQRGRDNAAPKGFAKNPAEKSHVGPKNASEQRWRMVGFAMKFSIGVSKSELESGDSGHSGAIMRGVMVRGITNVLKSKLEGLVVRINKLKLKEDEGGATTVMIEFSLDGKGDVTDEDIEKRAARIDAVLGEAMDEGDFALALAAAAREETGWLEETRDRVVEEFLMEDDDMKETWEDPDSHVDNKVETGKAIEAPQEPEKDVTESQDVPFGTPISPVYAEDDLFLGGGNGGVFFDYSESNAANSPFKGELGPLLVDAVTARAVQRHPRVIAIGDVHGCIDELQDLLRLCDYRPGDLVVFLGDLVCKGPDSISVVQMAREIGALAIRGNHDFEVIRWHQAITSGVDPPVVGSEHFHIASCLTQADMKWMYSMPWYISSKELSALFVHAGFVSGIRLSKQNPRLMMNMRSILPDGTVTSKFFNNWPWARLWDGPQTVLFGHDADRGLQQYEHAIGLDTGCVYGGRLTACILPEKRLVSVSARREYFKYRRKHYD